MKLKWLKIENFRIFQKEIKIDFKSAKINLIFGNNGSGKSTILKALMHIFDKRYWRNGFNELDANIRCKNEPIKISCLIKVENEKDFLNGTSLVDDKEEILVELVADIRDEEYESKIIFNKNEDTKIYQGQRNSIHRYINLIYISESPNGQEFKNMINSFLEKDNKIKNQINNEIFEIIKTADKSINDIQNLKPINEKMQNYLKEFKFSNLSNEIATNISNISSKNVLTFKNINKNERVESNGKGFDRISKIIAEYINETQKNKTTLIIWEEPENNLFFPYQNMIINWVKKLNKNNQAFVSTHSPNVISLNEENNLIKINDENNVHNFKINDKVYYKYQIELHKHVFSSFVLLVEGHSEKMFFEYLIKNNKFLKNKINGKNFSIAAISGVHFGVSKKILEKLKIKVVILTDNDKYKNEKLAGIKRAIELLEISKNCENISRIINKKNEFLESENYYNDNKNEFFSVIWKNNIYIPEKIGDSFEEELKNESLIDENELKELKNSKLKKISEKMDKINEKINEKNIHNSKYLFKWLEVLDDK